MEVNVENYNRNAVCCNLEKFDPLFASGDDFIEVCEWKNGEGYDIFINDRHYSFTHGELEAINFLTAQLNNSRNLSKCVSGEMKMDNICSSTTDINHSNTDMDSWTLSTLNQFYNSTFE